MGQQIAVISVEGVMQAEGTGAPISAGIALYRALTTTFAVGVSFVVSEDNSAGKMVGWMNKAGVTDHPYTYVSIAGAPRSIQLEEIRARGHSVALWVDANPETVVDLTNQGVPTLLFCHPVYTRPEHRPDYEGGINPWHALVEEAEIRQNMRAKDRRMRVE